MTHYGVMVRDLSTPTICGNYNRCGVVTGIAAPSWLLYAMYIRVVTSSGSMSA